MAQSSPTQIVSDWLSQFAAALEREDIPATLALFDEACFWRDLLTFTWNIKTLEGHDQIRDMLAATLAATGPDAWQLEGEATCNDDLVEAWVRFETRVASGRGYVRLAGSKCRTLLTTMTALKGHEEKKGERRELGTRHVAIKGRESWSERKLRESRELGDERQPHCLVIGGGQGGIALGARLRRLGVPTIIVEKNARAGDSWRNRYKSLVLHDPVWYDHLPYLPFPDDWPVFTPKDKMGDWLEMYAKVMELNYWTSTECVSASFDAASKTWTVHLNRDGEDIVVQPHALVLATGAYGLPRMADIPGTERFKGEILHSSDYAGGAAYRDKRCVVIGAGSSGHDVCADLWEHDAQVTMVQRSPAIVVRSETLMEIGFRPLYSEQALQRGVTTEHADLLFASIPFRLMAAVQEPLSAEMRRADADFYQRLTAAGFLWDFGEDESGLMMKALRTASGYYIDVGASQLIADGEITVRSGVSVSGLTESTVQLSDGTELDADVLIHATGYGSMDDMVEKFMGPDVARKVGEFWGYGSGVAGDPGPWEGELRNMWKPSTQEALWFHGGNLHLSRHYSLYVSLQIKARMEGIETPVFR